MERSYSMHIFVLLVCIYSLFQSVHVDSYKCDEGEKCPENLPYCTPVGCVYRCPDHVFINGTSCVRDCGDQYVYNRTCVPSCPKEASLVEEKIDFINSKFKKFKFCRIQCLNNTFTYNNTCIIACPKAFKYVEDRKCVSNCTLNTFHQKIYDVNGILVGIQCNKSCYNFSSNPFQLSNECVSKCKEDQVVFGGVCLEQCPKEKQLVLNLDMCIKMGKCLRNWPEQKYCSEGCPKNYFVHNSSCLSRCPDTAKYSQDGQCVTTCPEHKMFKYLNNSLDVTQCFEACPYPLFAYNYTCTHDCPTGFKSLKRMCIPECPRGTFVEISFTNDQECVSECSKKYISGNVCVDSCPNDSKYIADSHCLSECPKSHPYTHRNSKKCLISCPDDIKTYISKQECVTTCPKGTNLYEKSCLDECPKNTLKKMGVNSGEAICVDVCDKFKNNGTCVDSCPEFSLNDTCVDKCPSAHMIVYGTSCYTACPDRTCLMDNRLNCSDSCILDTDSGQLVYKCPKSAPYFRTNNSENHCVSSCEENEVLEDTKCINVTDCKRPVLSDGKCADQCPEGFLYLPSGTEDATISIYGYEYTLDSIKNNPCIGKTNAYTTVIMLGLFTAVYYIFAAIFLFSSQVKETQCWSEYNKDQNEELDNRTVYANLVQDEDTAGKSLQHEDRINEDRLIEDRLTEVCLNNERPNEDRRIENQVNEACLDDDHLNDVPMLSLAVENNDKTFEHVCMVDIHRGNDDCDDVPLLDTK
ncbi:proprotein convertase subtilisin/kexin type 5-like [Ruditapes philippinarum]|uniref:proprotein convertase subtilisin/kexin type 5-like n=1 Tax=Ruditapes philippinarum TaxID=129788 RepID=UPI00295AC506|nr:proprotein convertase subtilisin/kexin type 5-like [Ruditapes philippinarum]